MTHAVLPNRALVGTTRDRARWKRLLRRAGARFVAIATLDRQAAALLVLAIAATHAVIWTGILTLLKSGLDIHMDTAEAFSWGASFQLGYGKHPPMSGWLAGLWFRLFPAADWAAYALAMAAAAVGSVATWAIARRVLDPRRSILVVLLLMVYPVFSFKGYKFNADLLQVAILPLIVYAFLRAFETRQARWGLVLGVVAALGILTKYWALVMIAAIGVSALCHPDRWRFLRSAAPWTAVAVFAILVGPHVMWLINSNFEPLSYASRSYIGVRNSSVPSYAWGYLEQAAVLWVPSLLAGLAALRFRRVWLQVSPHDAIQKSNAFLVWIILAVLLVAPPVAALAFDVVMKSDWGIPLYFLVPIAVLAIPRLALPRAALVRAGAIAAGFVLVVALLSPFYMELRLAFGDAKSAANYLRSRSVLMHQLTDLWHHRYHVPLPAVIGAEELALLAAFYSPDHPRAIPFELYKRPNAQTIDTLRRSGFIGLCDAATSLCNKVMTTIVPDVAPVEIRTPRDAARNRASTIAWSVYIVPPSRRP